MIVAVDPYLVDWLDLTLRWLHVIAGVVWIGTSFYFVALDNHLAPPKRKEDADEGVAGESWEIHGGGFYLVQKFRVAPRTLPEPLHWFKWEAYTTWLSGFALFCVLYYVDADLNLVGADMSEWAAIASLPRAARRGLARVRRPLPRDPQRARAGRDPRRAHDRGRLRPQPPLHRSRRLAPARRDAGDDHGRERLLRHHPRPLGARPGEAGRPGARPGARRSARSSARSTTTTSRCRCCWRCSATTSRSPTVTPTAGSCSSA